MDGVVRRGRGDCGCGAAKKGTRGGLRRRIGLEEGRKEKIY